MRVNTTAWNRVRYGVAAPVYDLLTSPLQAAGFAAARRRALRLLDPKPGSRLLIVGAGTGLDLDWIPSGVAVTATDLAPGMVRALEKRAGRLSIDVDARVMDAEALDFDDETFDHVVLHLILAVVPDPVACAREAARVLKPGGTASIFDKFVPDGGRPSLARRAANVFANAAFSDLTRQLGPIMEQAGLVVQSRECVFFDLFTVATAERHDSRSE